MFESVARLFRPSVTAAPPSKPTARFMRPDSTGLLSAWSPALRSSGDDVRLAWEGVAARVIDAQQNQGLIAGAIDQVIGDTVGTGLIVNLTPDHVALGWTSDFAHDWARTAERRFRAWCNNPLECDARGKMTIGAMAGAIVRYYLGFGEGLARIVLRDRAGATTRTKVQLLSPVRLCQDTDEFSRLHQGVTLNADGMPIGYRFKAKTGWSIETVDVPARDKDGRPLVVHVFDGAPDQTRGISPFAPVLKVVRQFDQLADATLTTTLLQTIFAATFESAGLAGEALEGLLTDQDAGSQGDLTAAGGMAALMGARSEWYSNAGLDLGTHGRVNVAFPGDKLTLHGAEHPHNNYVPFKGSLTGETARCIGVTHEAFTGDYQGATFSSLKMGVSSIWPVVLRRRAVIPTPFMQAVLDAWLEEEVATGRTPFPGGYAAFLRNRSAASAASWRGPAKPSPDELKTAKALRELKEGGFYSLSTASAELGLDWETEADQKRQETDYYVNVLKLPDPHAPAPSRVALDDPMLDDEEVKRGRAA